jgi:hypothetical protein
MFIRQNQLVQRSGAVRKWPMNLAAAFALAPILASWLLKTLVWPRPFWIFHFDPETIYFYSGLSFLRGRMPPNIDNPGTPLQLISAAIAALTGATPLRYEQFLAFAHTTGLLLSLGGALAIFYGVMARASPLLRISAVWAYLVAPAALERLDIWSPEILYLPVGALVLALFRVWLESPSAGTAVAAGMLVGLGVATKFAWLIWAPALVLAMLSAGRLLHASLAAGGVGAGFVLGTLPVAAAYGSIFRRLVFLSGSGHGEQTWPVLLATSTAWQAIMVVTVLFAAWHFRRSELPWAVFAGALLAFGILATARNPTFRYLLPMAFAVVALMALDSTSDRLAKPAHVGLLAITTILLARSFVNDVHAHRDKIAEGRALRSEIESVLPNVATVIYGWRSPIPSFALRVMSTDPQDLRDISRRYPREGHFDRWNGVMVLPAGVSRWDYLVVQDDDLRRIPEGSYEIVTHIRDYVVARAKPTTTAPIP